MESWDDIDGRGIGDFDREGRGGIIGGVAIGIGAVGTVWGVRCFDVCCGVMGERDR